MNKGTSQKSRKNEALSGDYISLDERSMLDRVLITLGFSQNINFYGPDNRVMNSWRSFLMNDPTFIIAVIFSTDISVYKIDRDDVDGNSSQTKEFDLLKETTLKMLDLIWYWADLLNNSNYKGSLLKEFDKLLQSVNQEGFIPEKNTDTEVMKETYETVYGNLVFIQGKTSRWFKEELESSGHHHPHIGLLITFFKLFENVQTDINSLTKKHLDFYFLTLLQQQKKKLKSHTAIVALQLQQGIEELDMNEGDQVDLIFEGNHQYAFKATSATQLNRAEIAQIKTLYQSDYFPFGKKNSIDDFSINILYEAEIMNADVKSSPEIKKSATFSATLGEAELDDDDPDDNINLSEIGILISSPALILEKGQQEINLTFKITPDSYLESRALFNGLLYEEIEQQNSTSDKEKLRKRIVSRFFNDAFIISITDPVGWKRIEHCKTRINADDQTLNFTLELNEHIGSLVSFDTKIHEGNFDTEWPCIKIILNNDAQYHPYKILKTMVIEDITVTADVSEVTNLTLSNSIGNLDSSVPFTPFGPTPVVSNYLRIQNPLILQKNLNSLELHISWAGLPQIRSGFAGYYRSYPGAIETSNFKATIAQTRNSASAPGKQAPQQFDLFEMNGEYLSNEKKIEVKIDSLNFNTQINLTKTATKDNSSSLFIVLTSPEFAFGHPVFTEIYAEAALKSSRFRKESIALPNQPYTPVIERLEVKYSNIAREIMLRKVDNNVGDIKLVHIYPFGQVQVFPGPIKSQSFLLPQVANKGNLFIGLRNLKPGDTISLGFELVPAVYMHTVIRAPKINWEYLSNNEWEPLHRLILEDSTDGLIRSGIVKISTPKILQFDNTRLPQGKFWIRAAYDEKEDLNSKIKNIFTQAVSLVSDDQLNVSQPHLTNASKVQNISIPDKKGIDKIMGPFALELTDSVENDDSFYSRVSEQLRHKNRVVSNWDVERIILDKFDQIEKVRVYGRNSHPNELVKGSSLQIVLIPRNNLIDGTRRRSTNVDYATLKEVKKYISRFVSPFVKVEVSNPVYERLKVRCCVKFKNIQKEGYFKNVLNNDLISYLSPDIENEFIEKGFDESISKTEILNFIESRPYVDFVTEFSVLQLVEVQGKYKIIDTAKIQKINDLRTISAYAILTSAPEHQIEIIHGNEPEPSQISGIGDLGIESDFIISDADGKYI
ncbi:MAG: hypothetical protein WC384_22590 [Prolixibacteraceae bacterium]|jgi:hypothetical protein